MAETENVVQIGDLRLARARNDRLRQREGCQHYALTLDDMGEVVTCKDCKVQVSAYWALCKLTSNWGDHAKRLNNEVAKAKEQSETVLHLTAAKKAEAAWRKRDTVPTCPHCRRGVLPTDGFGTVTTSRLFELGLRAREQAERVEKGLTTVEKLAARKPIAGRVSRRTSATKPLPKWKDAPIWANWLTQSARGKWTWHAEEPHGQPDGEFSSAGQKAFAGTTPPPLDGQGIKQRRTEAAQNTLF